MLAGQILLEFEHFICELVDVNLQVMHNLLIIGFWALGLLL